MRCMGRGGRRRRGSPRKRGRDLRRDDVAARSNELGPGVSPKPAHRGDNLGVSVTVIAPRLTRAVPTNVAPPSGMEGRSEGASIAQIPRSRLRAEGQGRRDCHARRDDPRPSSGTEMEGRPGNEPPRPGSAGRRAGPCNIATNMAGMGRRTATGTGRGRGMLVPPILRVFLRGMTMPPAGRLPRSGPPLRHLLRSTRHARTRAAPGHDRRRRRVWPGARHQSSFWPVASLHGGREDLWERAAAAKAILAPRAAADVAAPYPASSASSVRLTMSNSVSWSL